MHGFEFTTAPRIVFGAGAAARLTELTRAFGDRVLLVLGGASANRSGLAARLRNELSPCAEARCADEPSVDEVDRAVAAGRAGHCDVVVAVGGGSVLDCGKAAAGMMTNPGSLIDYLEGVGVGRTIEALPLPMIAVPTTAGTGSEVTKNAVISGPGYKKSVRSPLLIPKVALVDPELTYSMPSEVTASCGMDALTQLIESYLSKNASPMTDGLALRGIVAAGQSLARAFADPSDAEAREGMALASLLGGICLANAGLGAVHGFAAPLGAILKIPHGVACAALLPQVIRANLEAARGTAQEHRLRARFAAVAEALTGERFDAKDRAIEAGLGAIARLQRDVQIPGLATLGTTEAHVAPLVRGSRGSSMRYNPVELTDLQLEAILREAM
jgi:alcohol dehydrogenase class IV